MNRKVSKLVGGNIKLGNMGTWSTLMGDDIYIVDGKEVKGTCGGHCQGCKKDCYVKKSYRYPSVILNHARNTIALREDRWKVFEDINAQMNRKRRPFTFVRLNQSGELESFEDFEMWCKLASLHQNTKFYIYTKNYDVIRKAVDADIIPSNMTVLISVWANKGINEFFEFCNHPSIKAFVYVDETLSEDFYKSHGLYIDTFCHAYDENGKLNHDITCDKCQKCMNRVHKVVGCFSH